MNRRQKLAGLVAGIALCVAAGTVQAGDVGFSISYRDYGHGGSSYYFSYSDPGYYAGNYNNYPYYYRPYYGNKDSCYSCRCYVDPWRKR